MKKKYILKNIDKPLLIVCMIFSLIGALLVLSASSVSAVIIYERSPYYFFIRQILFIISGYFVGFFIILKIPTSFYKKAIPIGLIGILATLMLLLFYGNIVNSAKSWFNLGFFSFQPSEFAKTILIIYMGVYFSELNKKSHGKNAFLIPLAIAILIFLLVAMQPDLGTATIIACIVFLTFLSIPMKENALAKTLKLIAGVVAIVAIVFLASGLSFLNDMQKSRLQFVRPCTRYTEETGYQVCNGFIAINNGGLFGVGIGKSTQKYLYLPEAHTDFIFPIAIEELGLVFGIITIIGYIYILFRLMKISKECYNLRNSIIVYGIMCYIFTHIVINFCGILALMPLTGVPVPFLSYGGSYTWNLIFAMFVVERIVIENKVTKKNIEIANI